MEYEAAVVAQIQTRPVWHCCWSFMEAGRRKETVTKAAGYMIMATGDSLRSCQI